MFTVSSWPTHYASLVPLGWALQAAGHEVRVLCAPSQTDSVAHAGLTPVPVLDGLDVPQWLRLQYYEEARQGIWPYPWLPPHPVTGEDMAALDEFDMAEYRATTGAEQAARAARGFDAALALAREWAPHLVLHDPVSLEGLLAARVLGVPSALCLWGPVGPHEPEHMRVVPDDHSGSFARHGLGAFHLGMIERVVDPCPATLEPKAEAPRLPVRYVPYNGGGHAPDVSLLSAPPGPGARPRILLTWSTALSMISGPRSYALPGLVRALEGVGCELLVTATARDLAALGPVPDSVRVLERAPLRLLAPACDLIVHHGGSGSTLTSLWAGVPQLFLTFASEQAATATRVATAGAARHLPGHQADPATVRAAVTELLQDTSYRRSATALREEMFSRPSPAELVTTLEALAAG
ncbi:nucleotide disphospho-sugar-binding domain-containing protein [Streptomyces nogalater]